MVGALWTESSYSGPHRFQPHLCRESPLFGEEQCRRKPRGGGCLLSHSEAEMVPDLEPGPLPLNLPPSVLGVTPLNPALPHPYPRH